MENIANVLLVFSSERKTSRPERTKPLGNFFLRGFAIFKAAPSYSPTV
jgi:hypothetical protein